MKECIICKNSSLTKIFTKNSYDLVKCDKCSLVFVSNPPTSEKLKELYSFDNGFHNFFMDDNSPQTKYHKKLSSHFYKILSKIHRPGVILDIGCSAGFFLDIAGKNGWQTYGIEMSEDSAKIAIEKYKLNVKVQGIDDIDFDHNYFDVITLWDVIEHLENPLNSLKKVNNYIKDKGYLLLATPNIDGLFPRVSYLFSKIINHWRHPEPPYHLFQFSKKTITRLLSESGFKTVKILDMQIRLKYTFGSFSDIIKSPKLLLYSLFFIPIVVLGPLIKMGDTVVVIARKE